MALSNSFSQPMEYIERDIIVINDEAYNNNIPTGVSEQIQCWEGYPFEHMSNNTI